jgi:hypothetical protein
MCGLDIGDWARATRWVNLPDAVKYDTNGCPCIFAVPTIAKSILGMFLEIPTIWKKRPFPPEKTDADEVPEKTPLINRKSSSFNSKFSKTESLSLWRPRRIGVFFSLHPHSDSNDGIRHADSARIRTDRLLTVPVSSTEAIIGASSSNPGLHYPNTVLNSATTGSNTRVATPIIDTPEQSQTREKTTLRHKGRSWTCLVLVEPLEVTDEEELLFCYRKIANGPNNRANALTRSGHQRYTIEEDNLQATIGYVIQLLTKYITESQKPMYERCANFATQLGKDIFWGWEEFATQVVQISAVCVPPI